MQNTIDYYGVDNCSSALPAGLFKQGEEHGVRDRILLKSLKEGNEDDIRKEKAFRIS